MFSPSNRRSVRTRSLRARLIAAAGSRAPNPADALAQVRFLDRHGFSGPDAVLAAIAVAELGPDHGFEVGLTALVRGPAPGPPQGAGDPVPPADADDRAATSGGR